MACSGTPATEDSDTDFEITKIDYDSEVHSPKYSEDGFDNFESSPRNIRVLYELTKVTPPQTEDIIPVRESLPQNRETKDAIPKVSPSKSEDTFHGKETSLASSDEKRRDQEPRSSQTKTRFQELSPPSSKASPKYRRKESSSLSILAYPEESHDPRATSHESPPVVALNLELIRREGNNLLRRSDVTGALNRYSLSIAKGESALLNTSTCELCRTLVRKILKLSYSSRAQLLLRGRMWDDVLLDTERALMLDPHHVKSLFRRGKALHGLQQFKQACIAFSAALDRNATNMQVAAALHESMKRHHQSISGEYDLSHFLLYAEPPPECSDYVGPVEIRETPYAGRGLFVTRRVKAGSLLLVSNALAITSTRSSYTPADLSVKLAGIIMNLTKTSKKWKYQVHYLTAGKPQEENLGVPDMKLFIPGSDWSPDPRTNVDLSFIDVVKKVTFNTFDASRSLFYGLTMEAEGRPTSTISSGVWVLPSFLNHSCIPNTGITFVGRAMFLRAARDLKAGEELSTSYVSGSNPNRHKFIRKWNFECRCERCLHDHLTEPYVKELKQELDDYCSCFSSKRSTKAERLKALFRSANMVERVETAIQSLPIELNPQKKNWVRISFMVVYINSMQVARAKSDLSKKVQALQKLAEMEESINGGGVYYSSMHNSAQLLHYMRRKLGSDTDDFRITRKQVMKVFKIALGDMGEMFFLDLIRHRFRSDKSGQIVWLDYTK